MIINKVYKCANCGSLTSNPLNTRDCQMVIKNYDSFIVCNGDLVKMGSIQLIDEDEE